MTHIDRNLFFKALGFLTVVIAGKAEKKNALGKAELMSGLIEEYCREKLPEAFLPIEEKAPCWLLDLILRTMKKQHKEGCAVDLPEDQKLMDHLFQRLQERQFFYLTDGSQDPALQTQAFTHLLEQDNRHVASEAKMMVVTIEGDPNTFTPYHHLATAIAEKIEETGECLKEDMKKAGFSSEEIQKNWNMAYVLAQVELMGD